MYQFSEIYTDVGESKYGTRTLSSDQKTEAKRLTNLGYMELVAAADWYCLHPKATLNLATAVSGDVALPAGFAYMESGPIFNAANSGLSNIEQSTPDEILTLRAGSTSGTYPRLWAVRPVAFTAATGQRWELMLWPSPSSGTVTIQYKLIPSVMSTDAEYPVGGNAMNIAVRAFAMRAAERDKERENGPRSVEADKALADAIREDYRQRAKGAIDITNGPRIVVANDRRLTHLGVTIS